MMDNDILTLLSPNISHFVIHLIRDGTIGVCNGQIKVTDFNSRYFFLNVIYFRDFLIPTFWGGT